MAPHIMSPSRFASGGFSDPTGLKAYWKFDESSGDIINQSQAAADLGSAADLQVTGATYSSTGIIDNGLLFDGVNDYVAAGTSVSQWNFLHSTTATWSINFWVKFVVSDSEDMLFSTGTGSTFQAQVWCYKSTVSDVIYFAMTNGTPSRFIVTNASTGAAITDTNWHMITLTYDYSLGSNNLKSYVDGSSTGNLTKTANTPLNGNSGTALNMMGNVVGVSPPSNNYLDEMAIFSRVLTGTEITELYNGGAGLAIY